MAFALQDAHEKVLYRMQAQSSLLASLEKVRVD